MYGWIIEKRVANTDRWAVVSTAPTEKEAVAIATAVLGGASTGVRIRQADSPYRMPKIIVGV